MIVRALVYDVGMHNGDDTAYYLRRGYRVVAIEANPVLAARAAQRFAREVAAGALKILNIGIAGEEGELPFWICDSVSEWSSFHREIASRNGAPHHRIPVACRRFRSILQEFGVPHYLKIDIEGNDACCLRDLAGPDLPECVSFERAPEAVASLSLLRDLGYTRFKLISQENLLPVEYPASAEQRRYEKIRGMAASGNVFLRVARPLGAGLALKGLAKWLTRVRGGWTFPPGSSGPFGEDLPGRWQSFDEIVGALETAEAARRRKEPSPFWDRDFAFWADFHAKRGA